MKVWSPGTAEAAVARARVAITAAADRVRALCERKFGGSEKLAELFPEEHYQLTHNALFPHHCMHAENLGGDIGAPELQNRRLTIGVFPWKFKGGEAAFCRAVAFLEE